ncbi:AAA family ATPase [Eubacteriales bacterium OttesenSCG-928-N13]|nr:AAA family ATPase [Eubacteriales bacterium OttesenSCG-928-N13]
MIQHKRWLTFAWVACGGVALGIAIASFAPQMNIDSLLRLVLGLVLIASVVLVFTRSRQPMRSGFQGKQERFEAIDSKHAIDFHAVAANEEALGSLKELVDYLREPEKYQKLGARMPCGVLLYGPPGTGKTLLAKALAGEAGVPFYALSGSDFVQMYVGVGASRVRELFGKARKVGKCVIFIDEIDAMGKRRDDNSSDERDQTLNALLSEMSGFHHSEGIIVVAATNRIDTLDPALLRPGRFDRQIEVGLPGKRERLSILSLHSKNKPIDQAVDMDALAHDTVLFSGASLESLLNEAAIRAARRGGDVIERSDIDAAYLTTVAGADKASIATANEKLIIALHEAGHALATKLLLPEHRLTRVSILPTAKGAAGYSLSIPPESSIMMKDRLDRQVQILLAGRAAERLIAGENELTAGASSDLQRAAELVSSMVLDLGMEGSPGVAIRPLSKACGGGGADAYNLCADTLNRHFEAVTALLTQHNEQLMRLVEGLIEHEALNAHQIDEILAA